jgi:serine/threonine protein kinase
MEYMENGDLRRKMRGDGISQDQALRYVLMIGMALKAMHHMGVFHRDVSPENIFLADNNEVRLGDMGCAVRAGEVQAFTGKMPYMAPEVLDGGNYTEKSDIYSLGAVLYELLGGNVMRLKSPEGPDMTELPSHIRTILERMCHADASRRYATVEMLQELTTLGAHCLHGSYGTVADLESDSDVPKKADWGSIRDIVFKSTFLEEQRIEEFRRSWISREASFLRQVRDDLKYILYRAFLFSLHASRRKYPNGYLGIEHVLWACLEEGGSLCRVLRTAGISVEDIQAELFNYLGRIRYFPSHGPFSPRMGRLMDEAKKRWPGGVGADEFVAHLLERETFFIHLLKSRGVDTQVLIEEMKPW